MSGRPWVTAALVASASACALPGSSPETLAPTALHPVGIEFVLIEPGTMLVGRFQPTCPDRGAEAVALWTEEDHRRCEEIARRDATPGFTVRIERPFYIGKYEVTQAQWRAVMGSNPSHFQGARVAGDSDRHPVDNVTWEDAQAFVRRLGELDRSARYRLPTEFEWEYAARAGATDDLPWQEIREQAQMGLTDKGTPQPVGLKRPNAWGLHDTLGNVWEWVEDHYNEKLFPDPTPPRTGTTHVLRGGSFVGDVKNVTYFTHAGGPGNGWDVGLRVVREAR